MPDAYSPIRSLASLCMLALSASTFAVMLASDGAAVASRGPGAAPIAWSICGEMLECARVRVPLDWGTSDGQTIELAVIRRLASRPDERMGSLFVNPGGPAGSVQKVRDDGATLDSLGKGRFDVVGWDIRGAGESAPVECFRSEKARARLHLQPGTVTVKAGDRVKTGTVLGKLGNSGNSTAPHLHFAILDRPDALVGDSSLPFVIDRFNITGKVEDATGQVSVEPKTLAVKDAYPLVRGIVTYH